MNDGTHADEYYENRESYIQAFSRITYSGDTLRAETLHEINACAETVCDFKVSNDTLFLTTRRVEDVVCASVKFHRFKYTIVMPNVDHYVVML